MHLGLTLPARSHCCHHRPGPHLLRLEIYTHSLLPKRPSPDLHFKGHWAHLPERGLSACQLPTNQPWLSRFWPGSSLSAPFLRHLGSHQRAWQSRVLPPSLCPAVPWPAVPWPIQPHQPYSITMPPAPQPSRSPLIFKNSQLSTS